MSPPGPLQVCDFVGKAGIQKQTMLLPDEVVIDGYVALQRCPPLVTHHVTQGVNAGFNVTLLSGVCVCVRVCNLNTWNKVSTVETLSNADTIGTTYVCPEYGGVCISGASGYISGRHGNTHSGFVARRGHVSGALACCVLVRRFLKPC